MQKVIASGHTSADA